MPANVFRFPSLGNAAIKPAASLPPPITPSVDLFDAAQAKTLHAVLEHSVEKGKVLTGMVREDRELASQAGLEGIGIEISALLDTERFIRTRAALEEAVRLGDGATITHEGLGRLHRLEALVAEGSQVLGRYQGRGKAVLGRQLGNTGSATGSPDLVLLATVLGLSAVIITLAAFLVTRKNAGERPYFGGVPSRVPPRMPARMSPKVPPEAKAEVLL
jgi:hypothetical protein